ncbi:hypothetical protein BDF20DRAFT_915278 [Mycotypha africana]|uniref:uncharacterized protein n=1 Tax=Mycotypha africana TaxID=64632 RepID=UPI002301358E|nr:uncharacterized protein BDF20DRAFT_915278 [Mycotypha africana]KAI8971458.1 hypothetical protein BDF20DRAFT_915278 [Mycotypha africana]
MSSFSQITPAQILQFNLNESALDLLNAAIASHQENIQSTNINADPSNMNRSLPATIPHSNSHKLTEVLNTSISSTLSANNNSQKEPLTTTNNTSNDATNAINNHVKRELEKDEQTPTAPKRAGRKPIEKTLPSDVPPDPKQKRKAQNRAAQRAFRDRKEKHVAELQARIAELEAHATKTEDLVKENQQLREQLQKLQEENYALKGVQFTFEFPVPNANNSSLPAVSAMSSNENPSKSHSMDSHSSRHNSMNSTYSSCNSTYNNLYSAPEETSSPSSFENSPRSSNSHIQEDDSSAETPNSLFTADPIQFGLFSSSTAPPQTTNKHPHGNNSKSDINSNSNFNFMAVADSFVGFGNPSNPFDVNTSNMFPATNDLFHGKDDLVSHYRLPTTNNNATNTTSFLDDTNQLSTAAIDDFLLNNGDLALLFGPNDDLFDMNNSTSVTAVTNSMNAQFGLPALPTTTPATAAATTATTANVKKLPLSHLTPEMKKNIIERLRESQRQGKHLQQVHKEICPDFDLDGLCEDIKRKVTCTEMQHPITDHIVDVYTKILDRV